MRPIRLIATDFDGTLFGDDDDNDPEAFAAFRSLLLHHRHTHHARWAVITGRHRMAMSMLDGQLLIRGLAPDFLVMEDARIYRRSGNGFIAYLWWNWCLTWRRWSQLRKHRRRVRQLVQETVARYPDAASFALRHRMDYWFRFPEEEQALEMEDELRAQFGTCPEFYIFRWGNELCLAPTAGSKGEALTRLASRLTVPNDAIFAVGDGQNDLSMLQASRAGMTACVANAAPEVVSAVTNAGGYVARQSVMRGTAEALAYYTDAG